MKDTNRPDNQTSPGSRTSGEPDSGSPSVFPAPETRAEGGHGRRRSAPKSLAETRGPDPATPLADVRLTVGRLGGPHGVHGEIKLRLLTDEPENLEDVSTVYLGERDTPIALESIRFVNDGALVRLEGTDSPETAAKLSGLAVKIAATDTRPLEEGEYFLFQVIGLKAENEQGEPLGTVIDIIETGAHDVLVIGARPGTSEQLLVPSHPEFVVEMLPEEHRIVLRPPVYE